MPLSGRSRAKQKSFTTAVDIGLTQTNILNNFRRSNEQLGKFDKIVYIAKLFNEEAHLLVGADISSLQQLRGRKVNLDEVGSGTSYSVRDLFKPRWRKRHAGRARP